ncbi:MAG: hypothetical protein AAB365_02355 [Patescibacteria group bacterium]
MKKHYYLLIGALALTLVLPLTSHAESNTSGDSSSDDSTEVEIETEVETEIEVENKDSGRGLPVLRERLRVKTENIQNNEEIRNKLLGVNGSSTMRAQFRVIASSTRIENKGGPQNTRNDIRRASSSDERKDIRGEMRRDVFEIRKQALIKQLNVSLNNLKQIRARISSRIDKAVTGGTDMTQAKSLLVTADAKITAATAAISEIIAFTPDMSVNASATSTTEIDLSKPREIGEKAIKAIKEAHKALVDVVRAIAHALGSDKTATTTPSMNATTTTTTTL